MRAIAFVSICGVLTFLGCQHNERIVEPILKSTPIPFNKYIHFELGDSLRYGGGILQTYTCIDSILDINGHRYYRFRNFPYGPAYVWPDLILRPDSDGNIRILNSYATDSGTVYSDSTFIRFSGSIGDQWTFFRGSQEFLGILESFTDTVVSTNTTYLRCVRIHMWAYPGREEYYWLAPGIGVVGDDYLSPNGGWIIPPGTLTWWNFHPRRYR